MSNPKQWAKSWWDRFGGSNQPQLESKPQQYQPYQQHGPYQHYRPQYPPATGTVITAVPPKPAPPPDNRVGAKRHWTEVVDDNWKPSVSPEIYVKMQLMILRHPHVEINSRCYMDENDTIVYTTDQFGSGSGSLVNMDSDRDLELFLEAKSAGYICNTHWHSHVSMSSFFSPTDVEHQVKCLSLENIAFNPDGGMLNFLVIGRLGIEWLIRRFVWYKDETGKLVIEYCDKHLSLNKPDGSVDILLDAGISTKPAPVRHQYQGQINDGQWDWYKYTYVPEKGAIQLDEPVATKPKAVDSQEITIYDPWLGNEFLVPDDDLPPLRQVSSDELIEAAYAIQQELASDPDAIAYYYYLFNELPDDSTGDWQAELAVEILHDYGSIIELELAENPDLEDVAVFVLFHILNEIEEVLDIFTDDSTTVHGGSYIANGIDVTYLVRGLNVHSSLTALSIIEHYTGTLMDTILADKNNWTLYLQAVKEQRK